MNLWPALQIVFAVGFEVVGFCSLHRQLAVHFDTFTTNTSNIYSYSMQNEKSPRSFQTRLSTGLVINTSLLREPFFGGVIIRYLKKYDL